MIAIELKEYAYSFEEMCSLLELKPSTFKRRIYMRDNIPPYHKVGTTYWFPKDLYLDWLKKHPIVFERGSNAS